MAARLPALAHDLAPLSRSQASRRFPGNSCEEVLVDDPQAWELQASVLGLQIPWILRMIKMLASTGFSNVDESGR